MIRDEMRPLHRALGIALRGKDDRVGLLLVALLAGGHVLIEDVPGTGKTSLAKALARALGATFRRIQFTPDLLPADVTGGAIWRPSTGEFELRPGPVFTDVLLADEINRASPRTQSALLEAMEEGQVSLEGHSMPLAPTFLVMATQNPVEFHGVHALPEAQMDRFLLRLEIGYPDSLTEAGLLQAAVEPLDVPEGILPLRNLPGLRAQALSTHLHPDLAGYAVALASATRTHPGVRLGASPRATMGLARAARARAYLVGRDHVVPEDIQELLVPAWAHRVFAREGTGAAAGAALLRQILRQVPVPR